MKNAVSANTGYKYFTMRNLVGALLFLIFVGEPTVGIASGLYTPTGAIVLAGLYLSLFWVYEALIVRYKLTYAQLVPLTFAIYSVLVTGLMHGELVNYAKGEGVITTLIRIQCSLYPIFAYYILNRYFPRPAGTPSLRRTSLVFAGYFLLLSPTHKIGFSVLLDTFQKVPLIALGFATAGVLALIWALKPWPQGGKFESKSFSITSWSLFILACIPNLLTLLLLLVAMPIVVLIYWRLPAFRQAKA